MPTHRSLTLVVVLALLLGPVGPAAAAEDPRFVTTVSEPSVQLGETQSVTVTLENDAADVEDAVEPVADVRATLVQGETPFEVRSGPQFVGGLADGERQSVTFTIVAPDHLDPGTYELPIELDYEHDDEATSTTVHAEVRVPTQPYFSIEPIDEELQPGSSESVTVNLTNVGSETARATSVSLQGSEAVQIREGTAGFLGDVAPNETRSVTVDASVAPSATAGAKPITASVEFRTAMNNQADPIEITGSIPVSEAQTFAVESVSDTLRVGFDGAIRGEVVNEGPQAVDDAVLVITPQTDSLYVEDTRYALPSLEPGERAAFEYPTDVGGDADAGPRQVTFTVEYLEGDTVRESSTHAARVEIGPSQDPFAVEGLETDLVRGTASTVTLSVTNQRDVEVTNIGALAYTESPLEAPGDEAFIPALSPGESKQITFEIEATGDARATTYPIELDFEYETPDGSTAVSDTVQVPVAVTEPETDGGIDTRLLLLGAGIVVALVVGGFLWWRD